MIAESARALADAARSGERSAEDIVRAHLERIDAANPSLNALIELDRDGALAAARAADERRASGDLPGPLHGVPITIKDSIEVAGLHCTAGSPALRERLADRDAPAVARLRAAGAIVLGKTNLPELSEGFETDNHLAGRTSNPWDLARTPGGSTGGEAALVAAGGSALGLGADTAGSVRVPAHFCGLAAIKPTSARIPISGHFPPVRGPVSARLQFAPLARSVDDIAIALGVLSREDWRDPESVAMPLGEAENVKTPELRVAFHADNGIATPTPATIAAVEAAARSLAGAGASVEEAKPSGLEATIEIMPGLFYGNDGGQALSLYLAEIGSTKHHPLMAKALERARTEMRDAAGFDALLADWKSFRHAMLRFMDSYDLILSPVASMPAPHHGWSLTGDPMVALSYAMSFSLTGWPAVVMRAGTSPEGLPIGIQIAARPWREDVALAGALQIERDLGTWPDVPVSRVF